MRPILTALMLSILLALPGLAQSRAEAIQGIIGNQFEAFKADDFDMAFSYASPVIKNIFQTPERFGEMVKRGYPMVWRPAEVRYTELRDIAGRTYQKVLIVDQNGALHLLEYEMVEVDGIWQINGVQFLQEPRMGA